MKNPFKKAKFPKTVAPRTSEEIQAEYQELMGKAARAQYLAYVHQRELEGYNQRLSQVNVEMSERINLDRAAAETLKKQEEKSDVTA